MENEVSYDAKIEDLENQIMELDVEKTDMAFKLEKANEKIAELEANIKIQQKNIKRIVDDAQDLLGRIEELQKEIENIL